MIRTFNFGVEPIVLANGIEQGRPTIFMVEREPSAEGDITAAEIGIAQHLGVALRMGDLDAARQFRDMVNRAVYDLEVTLEREAEYARQVALDAQAQAEGAEPLVPTGHEPVEAEVIEETPAPAKKRGRPRKAEAAA
jgi:hypothetical protein